MDKDELASLPSNRKSTTLCFLVRGNEVLLAMKKRGFGQGRWNGVGGKVAAGETPEQAAARETEEEVGVVPRSMEKVAVLHFLFPDVPAEKGWDQKCHVYMVREWEGEPEESEEMAPRWFPIDTIPFEEMWSDDPLWLPQVLAGSTLTAKFVFNAEQEFQECSVVEGVVEVEA